MSFLNKKIFSLDPEIFGIDLSDLSVKVMQLEREGKLVRIKKEVSTKYEIANIMKLAGQTLA